MLSERLYRGLRDIVRRVSGRVGDSLLTSSDYDGGSLRPGGFLYNRQERIDSINDAKEIRLENLRHG